MKTYSWSKGARIKIDPTVAGATFESLAEHDGLNTAVVVDAAADPTSPLHPHFVWDDAVAGHRYRLEQASYLIRNLRVIDSAGLDEPVHVFVSVTDPDASHRYVTTVKAMTDVDLRQQVLKQALKDIAAMQRRYHQMMELRAVLSQAAKQVQTLLQDGGEQTASP